MTWLTERLVDLRRHLDHLDSLKPRVSGADDLRRDLTLHNDVLFSLMRVCQLVIDISGELAARKHQRFEDYTEAVRTLSAYEEFPPELVDQLAQLPGFRNVVLHEYVAFELDRAFHALHHLDPIRTFESKVAEILRGSDFS